MGDLFAGLKPQSFQPNTQRVVEALINQYDNSRDGTLSPKDLPLGRDSFSQIDARVQADNVITPAELASAVEALPESEQKSLTEIVLKHDLLQRRYERVSIFPMLGGALGLSGGAAAIVGGLYSAAVGVATGGFVVPCLVVAGLGVCLFGLGGWCGSKFAKSSNAVSRSREGVNQELKKLK